MYIYDNNNNGIVFHESVQQTIRREKPDVVYETEMSLSKTKIDLLCM